jgi:hypothetical protein
MFKVSTTKLTGEKILFLCRVEEHTHDYIVIYEKNFFFSSLQNQHSIATTTWIDLSQYDISPSLTTET